jgi:D-3-phosphoglycerate dehydrogenase
MASRALVEHVRHQGIEADLDGHMLYIVNEDAPGFIGRVGTLLGGTASTSAPSISGREIWAARRSCAAALEAPGVKTVKALKF